MKVYEEAAYAAAELRIEVQLAAKRDNVVTPDEQELIDLSERVYVFAEATAIRQRAAQRTGNGGAFDRNILADLRKADALLASVPSQASKKNGLTLVRKANGTTRLVGRG